MTTPCRDPQNFGPDWKPCDCPIHDQVAEMLGLVSTTGRDFRPSAVRAAENRKLNLPANERPPRPRKPKDPGRGVDGDKVWMAEF